MEVAAYRDKVLKRLKSYPKVLVEKFLNQSGVFAIYRVLIAGSLCRRNQLMRWRLAVNSENQTIYSGMTTGVFKDAN